MKKTNLLTVGDVIKTNPFADYWGCALVLSSKEKEEKIAPMCHIGITPVIFKHDYSFSELNIFNIEILEYEKIYRLDGSDDASLGFIKSIEIYSRRINKNTIVIGNIDIKNMNIKNLSFVAGNGADGGWPFCGAITKNLGVIAVHSWRKKYDSAKYFSDIQKANQSHEEMLQRNTKQKST